MKKYLILLITIVSVGLFSCTKKAQQSNTEKKAVEAVAEATKAKPLAKTLLWKIEHPDFEGPSYLYGTMHMVCNPTLSDKVKNAIQSTDQVYLELDMDDPAEMAEMVNSLQSSTPISKSISPEQFKQLDSLFTAKVGMPLKTVDKMGLFTVSSLLSMKMLPCMLPKSMEDLVVKEAKAGGLDTYGLETFNEQMDIIKNAFTDEELFETMMKFEENKAQMEIMHQKYLEEDLPGLGVLATEDKSMTEDVIDVMLKGRNLNWVEQIAEISKENGTFYGVGAAHLVEEYGVINLLRDRGYTVTPVLE